jgi:hypothetical protein
LAKSTTAQDGRAGPEYRARPPPGGRGWSRWTAIGSPWPSGSPGPPWSTWLLAGREHLLDVGRIHAAFVTDALARARGEAGGPLDLVGDGAAEAHGQVGGEDQVPAEERRALARPRGLLVLDKAGLWGCGQRGQVEVEFLEQFPAQRAGRVLAVLDQAAG